MSPRKILKLLLGKATPFQLMAAAVLGGMLGQTPLVEAAGLNVLLILVLIILNANLVLAALVTIVTSLLSPLLLPASFHVGRLLLDGPTQPLFEWLINTPGTALLGLEYYAATGGIFVGAALGVLLGWPFVIGLRAVRRKLAALQEDSERYQRYTSRWWVKALLFLVAGTVPGRTDYGKVLERRYGNPIRPIGVVFAVLVVAAIWIGLQFFSEPLVTAALQRGLERANGATVDVGSADLDLSEGRLRVEGLAMADPTDLSTDLLRASSVVADVSGVDLLRKRMALDQVVLEDASHGLTRTRRGVLVGRPPAPAEDPQDVSDKLPDAEKLEKYVKTAKEWKERLANARRWLEKLSRPDEAEADELPPWERAAQRARELGYASVRAEHLIQGAPTLLVRELIAKGVRTDALPEGETLDIHGRNLSTHPSRQAERPHVEVKSSSGALDAEALLGAGQGDPGPSRIRFSYTGLPVDRLTGMWALDPPPVRGGTTDVKADFTLGSGAGAGGAGWLDFPLQVTLHDSTVAVPGAGATAVERFELPIRVRGPLDDPRLSIDDQKLADALAQAGANEAARRIRQEIGSELEGVDLPEDVKKGAEGLLGDLLGGGKDKKKKKQQPPDDGRR